MDKEKLIEDIRSKLYGTNYLSELSSLFTQWRELQGFSMAYDLIPEKLMLIVTEAAEAMEAYRDNNRLNLEEELADIIIRTLDLCGGIGVDIQAIVEFKMEKNFLRPQKHGKIC